jgi:hypothetical protein
MARPKYPAGTTSTPAPRSVPATSAWSLDILRPPGSRFLHALCLGPVLWGPGSGEGATKWEDKVADKVPEEGSLCFGFRPSDLAFLPPGRLPQPPPQAILSRHVRSDEQQTSRGARTRDRALEAQRAGSAPAQTTRPPRAVPQQELRMPRRLAGSHREKFGRPGGKDPPAGPASAPHQLQAQASPVSLARRHFVPHFVLGSVPCSQILKTKRQSGRTKWSTKCLERGDSLFKHFVPPLCPPTLSSGQHPARRF